MTYVIFAHVIIFLSHDYEIVNDNTLTVIRCSESYNKWRHHAGGGNTDDINDINVSNVEVVCEFIASHHQPLAGNIHITATDVIAANTRNINVTADGTYFTRC